MSPKFRLLVRQLRQRQELSQDELAQALGISRQSIISLERGEYLPSFPLLLEMIHFFNCSLEQLVEGAPALTPQIAEKLEDRNGKGGEQDTMQLSRWDPFQAVDRMHDEMSNMVERTFGRGDWSRAFGGATGAMNIHESDKEYTLEIQAPGFKENEVSVEFSDGVLTVSGEHKTEEKEQSENLVRREWEHASFSRSVRFAHPIKEAGIEARLAEGKLTIIAPKVEPIKPKVKKIEVKK